jgi:hypothetical protein
MENVTVSAGTLQVQERPSFLHEPIRKVRLSIFTHTVLLTLLGSAHMRRTIQIHLKESTKEKLKVNSRPLLSGGDFLFHTGVDFTPPGAGLE